MQGGHIIHLIFLTMAKTKAKPPPAKSWTVMAPGEAADTLSRGVHYSSKPINTNATASGVRLGKDYAADTGLVGYATLSVNRRVTTYIIGGAPQARPFNQAASVIEGIVDDVYAGCEPQQREMIHDEAKVLDGFAVVGAEEVDPRLRQMILALPGEEPIAITPLHSPIFSNELRSRTKLESEAQTDERYARRIALITVGGANNQNVGRNIYAMTRPLVFDAPSENPRLRAAMSIRFKGIRLRDLLPVEAIKELFVWRLENRRDDGSIDSRMAKRNAEAAMLRRIARHTLANAAPSIKLLADFDLAIEAEESTFEKVVAGILNPQLRDREWAKLFADDLLRAIENYRENKQTESLGEFGDLQGLRDDIADAALN